MGGKVFSDGRLWGNMGGGGGGDKMGEKEKETRRKGKRVGMANSKGKLWNRRAQSQKNIETVG